MSRRSTASVEEASPFRIRSGALDTVNMLTGKRRARWVVFQGSTRTGLFQLKLYKSHKEKVLKEAFTLTKDTYVGTERGTLQTSNRSSKRDAPRDNTYWAILLETDTIVFMIPQSINDSDGADLHFWDSVLKSYFSSNSWLISPLRGLSIPDYQLTIHINRYAMCLATLNPPKCVKRWRLQRITEHRTRDVVVSFTLDNDGVDPGNVELRAETASQARRILTALETALDSTTSQTNQSEEEEQPHPSDATSPDIHLMLGPEPESPARYTPSPTKATRPIVFCGQAIPST